MLETIVSVLLTIVGLLVTALAPKVYAWASAKGSLERWHYWFHVARALVAAAEELFAGPNPPMGNKRTYVVSELQNKLGVDVAEAESLRAAACVSGGVGAAAKAKDALKNALADTQ